MYVAAKHLTDYSSISRNNLNSLDSDLATLWAICTVSFVQLYNLGNAI